jgi:ribonuclease-3
VSTEPLGSETRSAGARQLAGRLRSYVLDESLFDLARVHRSYCAERPGVASNERLEFLGDSVLGLVVTDHLYSTQPALAEGDLARIRAAVVSTEALAPVAAELGIGAALLLGHGEEISGGREKPSILADALEAMIGATYLAGGLEPASSLVLDLLADRIAHEVADPGGSGWKNRLQEVTARLGYDLPSYELTESGPDHARHFVAYVVVGHRRHGPGEGPSKKQAEQGAAERAVTYLEAMGAEAATSGRSGDARAS